MSLAGIDVRQPSGGILFRSVVYDSAGALVTTGTTNLSILELRDDATMQWFDFGTESFKENPSPGAELQAMAHQVPTGGPSAGTGVWTYFLAESPTSNFIRPAVYIARTVNSSGFPNDQYREFQWGGEQGDQIGVFGQVSDTTPAADDFTTSGGLSAVDDFYNGSFLLFVTGALQGQAREVVDYQGSVGRFFFTGKAFPSAPADFDKFTIIGRVPT